MSQLTPLQHPQLLGHVVTEGQHAFSEQDLIFFPGH